MAAKRSFLLRLPPELWEDIKRWADHELRSVNSQIEYLLREAIRRRKRGRDEDPRDESRSAPPKT
jgi:hypothetical protein